MLKKVEMNNNNNYLFNFGKSKEIHSMLKKSVLTFVIAFASLYALKAQVEIKPAFGVNSSHLTTEHVDWKTQGRIGYQFGATVLVGKKFYFEPGIFWQTMSKDVWDSNEPESASFQNTISSIRIPALLGYHILGSEETLADLRFFAGFGSSFITGVKNDSDDLSKDDFKNFIFDFNAGVGVDVWIFFLEWNYVMGLTPVFNEGSEAKAQAFIGNLGIRIRL
jgi:hypothetical protein